MKRFKKFKTFTFTHESEGYSPGHPWYYKTGGEILSPQDILPYNPNQEKTRKQFGSFLKNCPEQWHPNKRVAFLKEFGEERLEHIQGYDLPRYQKLVDMGLEGFLQEEQPCWGAEDDPIYYYQALGLKYGHITYGRTRVAFAQWLIRNIKQESGYQKVLF